MEGGGSPARRSGAIAAAMQDAELQVSTLETQEKRRVGELEHLETQLEELWEARNIVEDLKVTSKPWGERLNPKEWVKTYGYHQQTKGNDDTRKGLRDVVSEKKNELKALQWELNNKRQVLQSLRETMAVEMSGDYTRVEVSADNPVAIPLEGQPSTPDWGSRSPSHAEGTRTDLLAPAGDCQTAGGSPLDYEVVSPVNRTEGAGEFEIVE